MIDILEAEETVGKYLCNIALLDDEIDEFGNLLDPCFPLDFCTHENSVGCTATLYERYNGAVVLRIDAEVADTQDNATIRQWALDTPGHLPYVQVRYQRHANSGLVKIVATHSVAVDNLSQFVLEQIVSSFDFIVPQWVTKVHQIEAVADIRAERERERGCGTSVSQPPTPEEDECMAEFESGSAYAPVTHEAGGVDAVLAELQQLIGLEPVKELVQNLADVQKVASMRELAGMKALRPSPHLVFTGNPGTGKTTVARLIGRLYKEMGLLKRGHVVETGRQGLIGGYVGQTALKTAEVLKSAEDGVLFIDEAYSLAVDHHLDYGREAIETILTHMENNRGKIAVVVAGYPDKMKSFLRMNPGLASRFDYTLDFPDFSNEELLEVFDTYAEAYEYKVTEAARAGIASIMGRWARDRNFANARDVRKLFNEIVVRHAGDLVKSGVQLGEALATIDVQHLPVAGANGTKGSAVAVGYL